MPNIGAVLRDEIIRLSRKETRKQVDSTKKASALYRRDIAALKREVSELQRQVKALARKSERRASSQTETTEKKLRFGAKGLRAQRARLGLSATDLGKLIGVSAQSIYNWESEKARPRVEQIARLARLRDIGKREATAQLSKLR